MTTKNMSIRSVIIVVFIALMTLTAASVGYIVFSNWYSSARSVSEKLALDMNEDIFGKIDSFLAAPLSMNDAHRAAIENGVADLENAAERERFFAGVLRAQPESVYSFSYGSEAGEYYGARRNASGDVEIMRNDAQTGGESWYYSLSGDMTAGERVVRAGTFDPRTRDWYKAAKQAGKPVFSRIYRHFIMPDLALSAAYPIRNRDGSLRGVLGTHIMLSRINGFLKEIVETEGALAVIAERGSGELVANSLGTPNFDASADGGFRRRTIRDAGSDILGAALEKFVNHKDAAPFLSGRDGGYYVSVAEYRKNGLDWILLSAIPERFLAAHVEKSIRLTVAMILICLAVSIAVYIGVAHVFLKPVDELIETTERFSGGDLSLRATIRRDDEIGRIGRSFNRMADTIAALVAGLEGTVAERTARLRLILDSAAEGIYGVDTTGACTFCNASGLKMLGYARESDLIGRNMHDAIHHFRPDGTPVSSQECRIFRAFRSGEGIRVDDEVFWKADGSCFDVEYHSYPQFRDGEIVGAVVTFLDNTERRENEERIGYLNRHDVLTGLSNRMFFENELRRIDVPENLPVSIVFGDVNGLKLTNDIFGHAAGDELLRKAAEILRRVCRESDVVSRVGGDEFAILLAKTGPEEARKIVERIGREFSKEKISAIKASVSVGFDTKTEARQSIDETLKNAEDAMYRAKTLDRKTVAADMIRTIVETFQSENPGEERHSLLVSDLCREIGAAMGMPETEIRKLRETGLLHDIGKIVLNDGRGRGRSPRTKEEIGRFQQHPVVGFRILNLFDETLDLAERVLNHHENWDGSGYPRGIRGVEIPLESRIVRIAESFVSMTDTKGGRSLGRDEALARIRKGAGTIFDPEIVEILARIVPERPGGPENA